MVASSWLHTGLAPAAIHPCQAHSVALRAPCAAPDSVFLPLDIVILLFGILSNHCPKKSWGGGVVDVRAITRVAGGDTLRYCRIYSYFLLGAKMALVKKSITVTDRQEQWIRAQIASGEYGNDSEYFRDLIRRDQEKNTQIRASKEAIQEGLESGVSDKTVKEIWAEAEQRYTARHG